MATSKVERQARAERKKAMAEMAGKLAKTANQRLRQLEKNDLANASNAYRYMERLHYDKDSATATDSQGRIKFNTNFRGKSYQEIQHEIGELTRFLEAKTSSVSGVKDKYYRGYVTLTSNSSDYSGLSFSEFSDLMRNETMKSLKKQFGSDVILKILEHITATNESWEDTVARFKERDIENSDWVEFNEWLNEPKNKSDEDNDNITDGGNIT